MKKTTLKYNAFGMPDIKFVMKKFNHHILKNYPHRVYSQLYKTEPCCKMSNAGHISIFYLQMKSGHGSVLATLKRAMRKAIIINRLSAQDINSHDETMSETL